MKKSLIALAVLAASGAAMAQSSVTLYGIADVFVGSKETNAINATRTGLVKTRNTVVDSGGLNGSRWGLRGSEDLGNGLKANFLLENGFDISNGTQAGALFGRQAFVGLSGNFGAVSLGRQYSAYETVRGSFLSAQGNSPTFDATNGPANGVIPTAAASASRIGAWVGYRIRIDNSIRYATPNISGFQAAVVYGLGEDKAPGVDATKNGSFSLTYANGPVGLALAYQDDEVARDVHIKNTAIGGNYDFGVVKAFAAFNRAKITGLEKQNEWSVGVRAPLGATTLVAQYAHSKGDSLGKSQSLGLSAEYSLSKRTTAYAALNHTKVRVQAVVPNADAKNNVFGLGVRHTF